MALHTRVLRLVLSGLMGALLVVSKQAMSGLPNLEPVSLLIILFALELPRETPGAITAFILLQGVLYGFGLWWVMYLYVWYLLALLAWLLRRMDNAFFWAVFSGLYGLCFGGLCAAVYLFAKTPAFALSWWLSGLSYDAMHGVGNFVLMLLLYRPLRRALQMAKKQLRVQYFLYKNTEPDSPRAVRLCLYSKIFFLHRYAFRRANACRTSPEKYSVPSAHTGPSPPSSSARATPASMLSAASAVQP